jgi:tRNA(His) guanylyltransferase
MKFDDLDKRMRCFETAHDLCVLPGLFIVARVDGRGFTRLTKEVHRFDAPFDSRFRDHMVATVQHLMGCGFRAVYGYTQSDEISLLLHREETAFERKLRKYDSVLAAEASACFSLRLGAHATFDCRLCQLPSEELVVDYFRWRQEDASRNALNAHCYWALRKAGMSVSEATNRMLRLSKAEKNDLLHQQGVNFGKLPNWQKRGVGLWWEMHEKTGLNPKTGQKTKTLRRGLRIEQDLQVGEEYAAMLRQRVLEASGPTA